MIVGIVSEVTMHLFASVLPARGERYPGPKRELSGRNHWKNNREINVSAV